METSPYQAYHFTIGGLSCLALCDAREDARSGRPGRCCLLVRDGSHATLIDAGAGPDAHPPGQLVRALRSVGVTPEEVDRVVLTHAHQGHGGGATLATSEPAFRRARILLARAEWEFWTSEPDLRSRGLHHLVAPIRRRLLALRGQIDLIGHDDTIAPGIRAFLAPGHTPGHLAVSVGSETGRLLMVGDVLPTLERVRYPHLPAPGDLLPEQALSTRLRLLDQAAGDGVLVHATHLPFPALGSIRPEGDTWRWEEPHIAPVRG